MRILAIQPGASYATADVYEGDIAALQRNDSVEHVYQFLLDRRIDRAGQWLTWNWRKSRRSHPDLPKPEPAEIIYWASSPSLEMAARIQPDWVVIWSGMYLLKDVITLLGRIKGVKTAIVLTECPYDDARQVEWAARADVVFVNDRVSLPLMQSVCRHVEYLPNAYDPGLIAEALTEDHGSDAHPPHDVVFVGSLFQERVELFSAVDWRGIDFAIYGGAYTLPSRHRLRKYVRGGLVPNATALAIYRAAKIGVNPHRQSIGFGRHAPRITDAWSVNPRALELAAMGTYQICDNSRGELHDIFGESVSTYSTPKELEFAIREAIANPGAMLAASSRAQKLAEGRTYGMRAEIISRVLASV